uniref:RRM domain-containing protein n=1 Tax=Astyanax mexicanus TaxID=7994 RepID=A0A8B9H909_ASTMX
MPCDSQQYFGYKILVFFIGTFTFYFFYQAGPVRKVVIPRGREGQQRTFGFVYYKHAEAVPYSIELLDGIWLYGRPISLKYPYGREITEFESVFLTS